MLVKELIEQLSKMDPNAEVRIDTARNEPHELLYGKVEFAIEGSIDEKPQAFLYIETDECDVFDPEDKEEEE